MKVTNVNYVQLFYSFILPITDLTYDFKRVKKTLTPTDEPIVIRYVEIVSLEMLKNLFANLRSNSPEVEHLAKMISL